jgi:hypothetical protein
MGQMRPGQILREVTKAAGFGKQISLGVFGTDFGSHVMTF